MSTRPLRTRDDVIHAISEVTGCSELYVHLAFHYAHKFGVHADRLMEYFRELARARGNDIERLPVAATQSIYATGGVELGEPLS